MSQATIEAGIVATIQLHADFDTTNCKVNDRRPLAKGLARVVYVSYNTHREEEVTIRYTKRIWTYNIDVLVPWPGEMVTLLNNVATETQKVVDILAQYPRLNGTSGVLKAILNMANTPDIMQTAKGRYRGRRHFLDVEEAVDPNRQE